MLMFLLVDLQPINNGGAGSDRLIGGGPDQFYLANGEDRVVDFDPSDGKVVSDKVYSCCRRMYPR